MMFSLFHIHHTFVLLNQNIYVMKKIINKSSLIALVLITLSASATSNSSSNYLDTTPVVFTYVKEGTQILIRDIQNYLLYTFNVEQTGQFHKMFDFTSLPDGEYFFELNENQVIQIKPFSIINGKVTFNNDKNHTIFKPVIAPKESKVILSWLSLKNEPFEVKIYDNENLLLYTENIAKERDIKRVFDMSQINQKNFWFTIKAGDKVFTKQIKLNQ